jgi:arsenate reductase
MFSNTFAGIAPASGPLFILAQVIGGGVAILLVRGLYPRATTSGATSTVDSVRSVSGSTR